jgi:hypothetical protein
LQQRKEVIITIKKMLLYTDSCVEFFVSPDDRQTYYNFEFNCIGTPLMRHNVRPHEGLRATPGLLDAILTRSSLGNQPFECMEGDFAWQLTVAIPCACFFAHPLRDWRGQTLWANCYKCGDELSEPHYLSLFPIHASKPNFHLPEFFQELKVDISRNKQHICRNKKQFLPLQAFNRYKYMC